MTAALYHQKLARALDRMGGLFTLQDILGLIADGKMQSFSVNNSWVITEVQDFPRARQLMFVAAVGDLQDRDALHARIFDYANAVNAGVIAAHGRMGWMPHARELGWRVKAKSFLYQKDM